MLTPKTPWRFTSGQDDASRLMLTIRLAGSTDSDDTHATVIPVMSPPRPAVITLTPPVRWRIAPRKSSGDMPGATGRCLTAEFIANLTVPRWIAAIHAGSNPPAPRDRPSRGGADVAGRHECRGRYGHPR